MLLSFPLDGDATTVEIISELIYDNSTTLDGRRFAQEFITRRRADVASKKPSGRAPSIADVVKAQPKPSQQAEWGGFKVVKQKKKKGGRTEIESSAHPPFYQSGSDVGVRYCKMTFVMDLLPFVFVR